MLNTVSVIQAPEAIRVRACTDHSLPLPSVPAQNLQAQTAFEVQGPGTWNLESLTTAIQQRSPPPNMRGRHPRAANHVIDQEHCRIP